MRISDWSSDVCSSDLAFDAEMALPERLAEELKVPDGRIAVAGHASGSVGHDADAALTLEANASRFAALEFDAHDPSAHLPLAISFADGRLSVKLRSEEHTSELQSLMRISYAVFCLKKKNITTH